MTVPEVRARAMDEFGPHDRGDSEALPAARAPSGRPGRPPAGRRDHRRHHRPSPCRWEGWSDPGPSWTCSSASTRPLTAGAGLRLSAAPFIPAGDRWRCCFVEAAHRAQEALPLRHHPCRSPTAGVAQPFGRAQCRLALRSRVRRADADTPLAEQHLQPRFGQPTLIAAGSRLTSARRANGKRTPATFAPL